MIHFAVDGGPPSWSWYTVLYTVFGGGGAAELQIPGSRFRAVSGHRLYFEVINLELGSGLSDSGFRIGSGFRNQCAIGSLLRQVKRSRQTAKRVGGRCWELGLWSRLRSRILRVRNLDCAIIGVYFDM